MTVAVRVEGLAQMERNLKVLREQFDVKTGGIIIRGLREGAKLIQAEARARVPHIPSGYLQVLKRHATRRGRRQKGGFVPGAAIAQAMLRSNIVEHAIPVSSKLAGGKPTVLVRVRNRGYERGPKGGIRFNRPGSMPGWWWWVEFGTSRVAAQPFMRPAFEAQKGAATAAFKNHVRKEIEQLFNKFGQTVRRAA